MKKVRLIILLAISIVGSVLFTSCIGSFKLTNKLLEWNRTIDNKMVNEIVFIAFCIVPVYEISIIADALVLNCIEFWSGTNPITADQPSKTIETEQGQFTVEAKTTGYHIRKQGVETGVDLIFDEACQIWSIKTDSQTIRLLKFKDSDTVVMYLPDGKEMDLKLNQAGLLAFKQIAKQYTYLTAR